MGLSIGIVGLPNVGKSTLFNVLTNAGVLAANYPFATIEPNTGVVPVPDERLAVLAKMYESEKIVPATVKFIDIAGLVAGASKGEGLGNKFLANIRETDAIVHVVRAFSDSNVVHVDDQHDPKKDIEVIETELALADIETVEKILPRLQRDTKSGDKAKIAEYEYYAGLLAKLQNGERIEVSDEYKDIPLLSTKPVIYVFNIDDADLSNEAKKSELEKIVAPRQVAFVSAKMEEELAGLTEGEREEFLASYGVEESGLNRLVKAAYATLGLQSYLTAGKKEVRAWTIRKGATAPEAAGVIHTDFEKGFIAASVADYDDLVRLGSEKAVKEAGLMRTEGRDYVMQAGDVVEFRFNV